MEKKPFLLNFKKIINQISLKPEDWSDIRERFKEIPINQQIGHLGEEIAHRILSKNYYLFLYSSNFLRDGRAFGTDSTRSDFDIIFSTKEIEVFYEQLIMYLLSNSLLHKNLKDINEIDFNPVISQSPIISTLEISKNKNSLINEEFKPFLTKITKIKRYLNFIQLLKAPNIYKDIHSHRGFPIIDQKNSFQNTHNGFLSQFPEKYQLQNRNAFDLNLIKIFPYLDLLISSPLDFWAKKKDSPYNLPLYSVEVKSSFITCDKHGKRGNLSFEKSQRDFLKKVRRLKDILIVFIAKVNICECNKVDFWLIELN